MTPADLNGADFVGYDCEPAIVVKPNEPIRIPLFVSHYSDRKEPPELRWKVIGYNHLGEKVEHEGKSRPVTWTAYGVKAQEKPISLKIDTPYVGAVGFELVDKAGKRIAANFVNIVVAGERPAPRIERKSDREAIVRFDPEEFSKNDFPSKGKHVEGKVQGRGKGSFTYKLKLPDAVTKANPVSISILAEASSRADRERVDWPERTSSEDNPQTDEKKWPSTLELLVNGKSAGRVELTDDPADARGVLSHLRESTMEATVRSSN